MKTIGDIDFAIFFFASGEGSVLETDYRLLMESTKFADTHDFSSVWVPERHFTQFGCLYPNPSVLAAALAMVTEQIRLCAGSVVMPLHSPIRVAEEWAVVDRLSQGRIGLSVASGWNPDDFAFFPDRYPERREAMYRGLELVRRVWNGETVTVTNGAGQRVEVTVYPTPYQDDIPVWLTAAGTPATFERAGMLGANLLTHMLDQDLDTLGGKIALYREARARAGHDPLTGCVTVMLHTFVGPDAEEIREEARQPYCRYLKNNLGLAKGLAYNRGHEIDFDALSEEDLDSFLNFLYDRFVFERALIGSPETCESLVGDLFTIGADEIACLLDFGPREDRILENLPYVAELRTRCRSLRSEDYPRRWREPGDAGDVPWSLQQEEKQDDTLVLDDEERSSLAAIRRRCEDVVEPEAFYEDLAARGLELPEELRVIQSLRRRDGEALAGVEPGEDDELEELAAMLLEGAYQAAAAALSEDDAEMLWAGSLSRGWPPEDMERTAWVHAQLAGEAGRVVEGLVVTLRSLDETGGELGRARLELGLPEGAAGGEVGEQVSDWLYELCWDAEDEAPEISEIEEETLGTVLILADRGGVGERLAERLTERGWSTWQIRAEEYRSALADAREAGDTTGRAFAPILEKLESDGAPSCRHVVHLWSLDMTPMDEMNADTLIEDQWLGVGSALQLIQALAERDMSGLDLHLVTRGVESIGEDDRVLEANQAPLWALGRTCAAEYPTFWGRLIDLDPEAEADRNADHLLKTLLAEDDEDQVGFRQGVRSVARLRHVEPPERRRFEADPEGAYLITGGLQGIGAEVARWLVTRGARHLILVGRTELPPREHWKDLDVDGPLGSRVALVRELEALGVEVEYPPIDVSRQAPLQAFLDERRTAGRQPIHGAFHAATVWRTEEGEGLVGPLSQVSQSAFDVILPPKLAGGWLLVELLKDEPLDFLFLFSAGAALLGPAGQGNYAAANYFLDILAHDVSRRYDIHAVAVDWGPISETGFGATPEGAAMHGVWERRGILSMSPMQLLEAIELTLTGDSSQVAVMRTNWDLLRRAYGETLSAPWASELVEGMALEQERDIILVLEEAEPEERRELFARHVQRQVVTVLGLPPDEVPALDEGLFDLGMDSLLALELKNRVQANLRKDFPVTAVFDYPTIEGLATHLLHDVLGFDVGEREDAEGTEESVDLISDIGDLSEEEVEQLLGQKMAREGAGT